ncbi:MAG: hypothetical protein KDC45_09390 [Bacteroidetes bacterium]|nr:hypothetical protein [Bacteroidota bacterium]
MLAYSEKINEVSTVERVTWHQRFPASEAEWRKITGERGSVNCVFLTHGDIQPREYTGSTTIYGLRVFGSLSISFVDSSEYISSSIRVFDEAVSNLLKKFSSPITIQVDGVDRIRVAAIEDISIPEGLTEINVLGDELVHNATWNHMLYCYND